MKNIVLTGFMASGKTSAGKMVSQITGLEFFDMDEYIETKAGQTVSEIFEKYGEEYFRELESEAAAELSKKDGAVISCGGGTVMRKDNIDNLRKNGIIINLNPSCGVIRERLSSAAAGRPLLNENDLAGALERFSDRKKYYDNCDFKVQVVPEKSVEDIAREIIEKYNSKML